MCAIRSMRSCGFFNPANTILFPFTNFFGHIQYIRGKKTIKWGRGIKVLLAMTKRRHRTFFGFSNHYCFKIGIAERKGKRKNEKWDRERKVLLAMTKWHHRTFIKLSSSQTTPAFFNAPLYPYPSWLPDACPIIPFRFGPCPCEPPASTVWHCEHFVLNIFAPFFSLAFPPLPLPFFLPIAVLSFSFPFASFKICQAILFISHS